MTAQQMPALRQLIVTTGAHDRVPFRQMDPALLRAIQTQFATMGGPVPGGPGREGWTFELMAVEGGVNYSLSYKGDLLLVAGVAWKEAGATRLWPWLEKHHLAFYDAIVRKMGHDIPDEVAQLPHPGTEFPWLAIIILPKLLLSHFVAYNAWVSKFIPAIAWAILDNRKAFKDKISS